MEVELGYDGPMRTLFVCVLLAGFGALAGDDLSAEKMGQLEHEQQKAAAAIDKKYGNRKPSEMSNDERREMIREKSAAEQQVLDKNGVDKKDYVRAQAHMNKEGRETASQTQKSLQKKDEEAAAKKDTGGQKEIVVEHGIPKDDVNEAAEMDKQMGYKKK